MATCPSCYEFLGDAHVCRKRFSRKARNAGKTVAATAVGGTAGVLSFAVLGNIAAMDLQAVGFVVGATAAMVVVRSMR